MSARIYRFHVRGMHCASCALVIEDALKEAGNVESAKADLATREVVVVTEESGESEEAYAELLSRYLAPHGYTLSVEKARHVSDWSQFFYALPFAAMFIAGFVLLQKAGIINLVNAADVGYGTAFFIGIIASLSTCLAVVGGLVLSVSSNYAKGGEPWRPQVLFHASRLLGFFVLGGAIGVAGGLFRFGERGDLILGLLVALVMFVLGINLLDVFHVARKLQPTLPKLFGRKAVDGAKSSHVLAPVFLGALTFFLPCGFTQSMQIYTLTTGSFLTGALTMFMFALGTLPVLALLSFGSFRMTSDRAKGIFFKTSGIIVIMLSLWGAVSALTAAGILPPLIIF